MNRPDEQLQDMARTLVTYAEATKNARRELFPLLAAMPAVVGKKTEAEESAEEAVTKTALLVAWQQAAMNERLLMELIEKMGLRDHTEPVVQTMPAHGSMQ